MTNICEKCGKEYKVPFLHAPIESLLCSFCCKIWFAFYEEKHKEILATYPNLATATYDVFIGKLPITPNAKEKVQFT